MLGRVMELQTAQHTVSFGAGKASYSAPASVGRQIVHHDADQIGPRVMDIDQVAHALGEILRCALVGDLHLAPWPVRIEENEQVDRAITAIFVVVAPGLARRQPGSAAGTSPISCVGLSSKQTTGRFGSGVSA